MNLELNGYVFDDMSQDKAIISLLIENSLREKKYKELRTLVIDTFFKHNQKMGARKVYDYLINKDVTISLSFVKSVSRSHHLVSRTIKTYKKKKQSHKVFKNKLNRHFEVSESNQEQPRVVCDITEWKLNNSKKVYLCAAIELSTRAVVGYKVDLNTESTLVVDVIQQIKRNFPSENVLFHSDQGSQFTNEKVTSEIDSLKWIQSMSLKGNCWDNAVIE